MLDIVNLNIWIRFLDLDNGSPIATNIVILVGRVRLLSSDFQIPKTFSHPSSSSHSLPRHVLCHPGHPAPTIMGGLLLWLQCACVVYFYCWSAVCFGFGTVTAVSEPSVSAVVSIAAITGLQLRCHFRLQPKPEKLVSVGLYYNTIIFTWTLNIPLVCYSILSKQLATSTNSQRRRDACCSDLVVLGDRCLMTCTAEVTDPPWGRWHLHQLVTTLSTLHYTQPLWSIARTYKKT